MPTRQRDGRTQVLGFCVAPCGHVYAVWRPQFDVIAGAGLKVYLTEYCCRCLPEPMWRWLSGQHACSWHP